MISYVVVEPNKAHVVVTRGKGRTVFHPSLDGHKSAYWYIPFIMRRIIISLENVKHEINDIVLHDKEVAPFKCDITCWFKIVDPELAAEKLDIDADGSITASIRETLNAQVQGVARDAAMHQEILDLMRDRLTFGNSVFNTVNGDLDAWGVQLVKLEIIDFSDADGGHVIEDYEKRRESKINSMTRQEVANNDQEANVKEALALKTSEQAKIDTNQEIQLRDIQREQTVGTREQQSRLAVAEQADKANAKEVAASKTKVLGEAAYTAEALAKKAEGEKLASIESAKGRAEAVRVEATASAEATEKTGKAAAEVIRQKGIAEADATEKKADAQKKFQDASKDIEMAKIAADIQKTKFIAMGDALKAANLQIVGKDLDFMGFDAEDGAALGMLIKNLQDKSGIDVGGLIQKVVGKTPAPVVEKK